MNEKSRSTLFSSASEDWALRIGDCREVLAAMPDESIDAIVCDPPYELGFMGKKWDASGIAYDLTVWREALRVLKPGGHLLAFGGTRTYHRMACAIEDAGFEVRDSLHWIYGSGFPKSMNLGDGRGTAVKPAHEPVVMARKPLIGTVAANVLKHGTGAINVDACRIGGSKWGSDVYLCASCAKHAGKSGRLETSATGVSSATSPAEQTMSARVNGRHAGTSRADTGCFHGRNPGEAGEGQREGSNSNIEESGGSPEEPSPRGALSTTSMGTNLITGSRICASCRGPITQECTGQVIGRWPSNALFSHLEDCVPIGTRKVKSGNSNRGTVHGTGNGTTFLAQKESGAHYADENGEEEIVSWNCAPGCAVAELDRQSGVLKSGRLGHGHGSGNTFGVGNSGKKPRAIEKEYGNDSGGASRFFYVAKPSRSERDAGLEHLAPKSGGEACDREEGSAGLDNPRAGAGRNGGARNVHPTVKPIALMRYLCRLITPPGGVVLDPFLGSGTTGCAAVLEGFRFVGIEKEPEYLEIAKARIEHHAGKVEAQGDLFKL